MEIFVQPNVTFLFSMQVVKCYSKALVSHGELLEKVLDNTIHVKCWEGYNLASKLLANILKGLASIRLKEGKSNNEDFGKHVSEYLPVRVIIVSYLSCKDKHR